MALANDLDSLVAEVHATGYNPKRLWTFIGSKFPDKKMLVMAVQTIVPDAQLTVGVMLLVAFLQTALRHTDVRDVVDKAESLLE